MESSEWNLIEKNEAISDTEENKEELKATGGIEVPVIKAETQKQIKLNCDINPVDFGRDLLK